MRAEPGLETPRLAGFSGPDPAGTALTAAPAGPPPEFDIPDIDLRISSLAKSPRDVWFGPLLAASIVAHAGVAALFMLDRGRSGATDPSFGAIAVEIVAEVAPPLPVDEPAVEAEPTPTPTQAAISEDPPGPAETPQEVATEPQPVEAAAAEPTPLPEPPAETQPVQMAALEQPLPEAPAELVRAPPAVEPPPTPVEPPRPIAQPKPPARPPAKLETRKPPEPARPARPTLASSPPPSRTAAPMGASQSEIAAYRSSILSRLAATKHYPDSARRRGAEGLIVLSFHVDAAGRVEGASLVQRSGQPELDEEALAMTRRVGRLPPPPGGQAQTFNLRINFRLQ